jgi:hypothetical protein
MHHTISPYTSLLYKSFIFFFFIIFFNKIILLQVFNNGKSGIVDLNMYSNISNMLYNILPSKMYLSRNDYADFKHIEI